MPMVDTATHTDAPPPSLPPHAHAHAQGFGQLISAIGGIDARPRDVSKAIQEGCSVGICPGALRTLA